MDITLKIGVLAELTKTPAEELKSKLTNAETGEALPSDKIKSVLSDAMRSRFDTVASNAAGRATKDALSKREKAIAQKYDISDYSSLDDLVEKIASKNAGSFDESKILSHPTVVAKLSDKDRAIKASKQELKELQATYKQKEFNNSFNAYARNQIKNMGYDVSNDGMVNAYVRELRTQTKWKQEGNDFVPIDDNGLRMQKDHEDLNFSNLVEQNSWLSKSNGSNSGNGTPPPPGGNNGGKPTNNKYTSADYKDVTAFGKKFSELSQSGDHAAAAALEKDFYATLDKK